MPRTDVTQMAFAKLYPLLVNKAEKKGRTRAEVDQVTSWLTGYTPEDIAQLEQSDTTYGAFFQKAPAMNPDRALITGKVCGVRVEEIEDPLMRNIRYLDKLVDERAKGKPGEQTLRKCQPPGVSDNSETPGGFCLKEMPANPALPPGCGVSGPAPFLRSSPSWPERPRRPCRWGRPAPSPPGGSRARLDTGRCSPW